MTHRTYKINVRVVQILTYTVEVPKTPGCDDLMEAYRKALVAAEGGDPGEFRARVCETVAGSHDLVEEVKDPTIEFKNLAPAGSRYGWLITRDALFDEGDEPEDVDGLINEAGVHGPSDAVLTHKQIREHGVEFQMLDDDGTLYYEGKIAWAVDYKGGSGFEPLEDFGRANAGCTEIRYRDTDGEWRTL
jgi:hypothetical protein